MSDDPRGGMATTIDPDPDEELTGRERAAACSNVAWIP